jgi:hypothetical protein
MIANNCPLGRVSCDGCNYFTTVGCIAKPNTPLVFSITHDGMVALWERRKNELMKLSKEELVEMIIGKREYIGMIFG